MFTGLIQELGTVESVQEIDGGARLRVAAELASELSPGDSIAVDGACLTAASAGDGGFEAEVMRQTLSLTTLGSLASGDPVNLELPLRLSDRLGGHLVQGHVDGRARVAGAEEEGIALRLSLEPPPELARYVVERGSVALGGVSLTVASVNGAAFEVALIPETRERTNLGRAGTGTELNLECDLLARYVERLSGDPVSSSDRSDDR
jgi:riboflavin synthase